MGDRLTARELLQAPTVQELKENARELVELCEEQPIPQLAPDAPSLARDLMELLVRERARSRALIALFAGG